ncbi:MAG TPA: hypothetical protein ENJ39_05600 [Flammeovirgaceae bacterium]|nr:hypothetical protein [Flammeovirgaceae bacterium]
MHNGLLHTIVVFGTLLAIVYILVSSRHKERLALIEKGMDAGKLKASGGCRFCSLKIALLAIGIGIGILLGNLLDINGLDEDVAYPAMIFIMGGIGLLSGYLIANRHARKNTE